MSRDAGALGSCRVMVKQGGDWKVTVDHNVGVKSGVTAP
jgi:hypothetical protein